MYSSNTSSDEEDAEGGSGRRAGDRGGKSKKKGAGTKRGHRKRRSRGATPTPSTEGSSAGGTYSESLMSASLADRSKTREEAIRDRGGFVKRLGNSTKLLICNLPLSFAAISFSIVLLGVAWLKWAEEALPSCKEVSFHSSQYAYPDFPECYFCDEYERRYVLATRFHDACCYIGGISAMLFFVKAIWCWRAFLDEMSSPTTASPGGLIFMTVAMAFAGRGGAVEEALAFAASTLHLALVVWFIYMSLAYQTMPDPRWVLVVRLCARVFATRELGSRGVALLRTLAHPTTPLDLCLLCFCS